MRLKNRWDKFEYSCITSASYSNGHLSVSFADGAEATADVEGLIPAHFRHPRWEEMSFSRHEVVVPTEHGDLEVPYDVIRRATDPEYAAFWEASALAHYRQTGARLAELRQSRNLTLDELAIRTGLAVADLERIEQGDPDLVSAHTTRLLEALGLGHDALIARPVKGRKRKTVA